MIERNMAWLPKIKSWLKEGEEKKPFIAVGAAHLFGEQGLIDLLRKEGYELLPVLLELPEEERKPLFSKKRYFSEDWLETMPRFFKLMNEYSSEMDHTGSIC